MKTKKIAFLGLMLALIIALSALEQMIQPPAFLPPGIKLGLANIVVMYCVFFVRKRDAAALAALKSAFVFFTRGASAGLLSLCGGLLSLFVIIALAAAFKNRISYTLISVSGATGHNAGQLLAASALLGTPLALWYLPVLAVSGIIMGVVTGMILRVSLPAFNLIFGKGGLNK